MADNASPDNGSYQKGKMDLSEHQRTWDNFMAASKVGTIVVGALVAWLTVWLGGGIPWFAALVGVLIATAVIAYFFG